MIYYVAPDNPTPSGGIKTQYRHVEILDSNGFPARVLHQSKGFTSATWFSTKARVVSVSDTEIGPGDVLVWPEILGSSIPSDIKSIKNVVFNQNVHYSFRSPLSKYPGDASLVLTSFERDFLKSMDVKHPIYITEHGIDPNIFNYDGRPKKKQIAYMPRKHADEAQMVFGWLGHLGLLDGWKIIPIDNKDEKETSEILQDSLIFFAFGYPEGGTIPPFESMACGCQVFGYGGFASDHFYSQIYGAFEYKRHLVQSGNTTEFVQIARDMLTGRYTPSMTPKELSIKALVRFSMEREKESVLKAFREICR